MLIVCLFCLVFFLYLAVHCWREAYRSSMPGDIVATFVSVVGSVMIFITLLTHFANGAIK